MNDPQVDTPDNPLADRPLHHLLFVKLRNSALLPGLAAPAVAARHALTMDEVKAHCRVAAEAWRAREGALDDNGQRVYDWARS
jgi:hypothetical protein